MSQHAFRVAGGSWFIVSVWSERWLEGARPSASCTSSEASILRNPSWAAGRAGPPLHAPTMGPPGSTSARATRGVLVLGVLCALALLSSLSFLPSGDSSPIQPSQPLDDASPHTPSAALTSLSVLCSMGEERSSWCSTALKSSKPLKIASGAAALKELLLVAECLASSSQCEARSTVTVMIAEDPRTVAAECIAHGELEREECVGVMDVYATAFARLFELSGGNMLRVSEGVEEQVYRDRHWFVCRDDASDSTSSRCALVLDYIDLSERPGTSSVALERFFSAASPAVTMDGSGLELAVPPPLDRVFSTAGQYGGYRDILTSAECDLVPASAAQSKWMAVHGHYRHDQRTVVGSLLYYTAQETTDGHEHGGSLGRKKKAQDLSNRVAQARAFLSAILTEAPQLEVVIVAFLLGDEEDGKPLPKTLMKALDWMGAQERVTLELLTEWPHWFDDIRSRHLLKGAVLTHDLMVGADVAVFRDLDTVILDAMELTYYSPRHLRMNVADHYYIEGDALAKEWELHDLPEPERGHHTMAIDGTVAPFFWHNGGLVSAPGYVMRAMGWEIIERGNAVSLDLAARDMFAITLAYHRILPPFSPLPVNVNFNVRTWIKDICSLVHTPIVSVHYLTLSASDGAPSLAMKPEKTCAVYEDMLAKFVRLSERYLEFIHESMFRVKFDH